jgi:transcriptional regulator with XRE-family HTH domain
MQNIHAQVLEQLQASKGNWPEVARGSGVSYRTLKKIATGTIASPRVKHLEKLADYFRDQAVA